MHRQEEGNSNDSANNIQDEKLDEYIRHLLEEKSLIDEKECPFAHRFIDEEINRAQQKLIKGPPRDTRYIDIYHERPMKVTVKVLFPIKEHPRFNFVGKLLGPKGSTLKQLQENTRTFMNIHGRGSMRDREKEEELRRSCEPKYAHLTEDLHVEISALAPPAEAHSRISSALNEIRKHLVPDYDPAEEEQISMQRPPFGKVGYPKAEWVRQSSQNEEQLENFGGRGMEYPKPEWKRQVQNEERSQNFRGRGISRGIPRPPTNSKSSVMSILNKARIAMEESYSYQQAEPEYGEYDQVQYPPRRYQEENYGKNPRDVNFKKRKF